jgi:hypothetical protein
MKVLVKKSYCFVEKVWAAYLASNVAILEYVVMMCMLIKYGCAHCRAQEQDESKGDELEQDGVALDDVTAGIHDVRVCDYKMTMNTKVIVAQTRTMEPTSALCVLCCVFSI